MERRLRHLFSPLQVGPVLLKNRLVSTAHGTGYGDKRSAVPGDRLIGYWESKAKGGVALILTESTGIHRSSYVDTFAHPDAVVQFRKAAHAVHRHGAKIMPLLTHLGAQTIPFANPIVPWAPSVVPSPADFNSPHEMTEDEITVIANSFVRAATACREADLDGVEVNFAHGYLISEFLSPFFNRRSDHYGGNLENRLRFPLDVLQAIRKATGSGFAIGIRISGDEFIEGGNNLDDMRRIIPILVRGGKLDFVDVSAGTYRSFSAIIDPMYYLLDSFVYLAAAIKEVVDVPVIARGRIVDPLQAEEILAADRADLIGMCRALVADPELPRKAREGRFDELRKCIGCNQGCIGQVLGPSHSPMRCTVNSAVGRETERGWGELEPAARKKRVMVIGAGPAGLETARIAALRGHTVFLYDKNSQVGGQVLIAARAPSRESFLDLPRYYEYQMKLLNVEMHLDTDVSSELVRELNPDAVVVATGSIPIVPDIPGIEQQNVVEVRALLDGKVEAGANVVVIDGEHHIQGLSAADFLASGGRKVEVLCEPYYAGSKLDIATREAVYRRLLERGVVFTPLTRVRRIVGNTVVVVNVLTSKERLIEGVDTVVYACGGKENTELYYSLRGQAQELYKVGDCAGVRAAMDATLDGATLGRKL